MKEYAKIILYGYPLLQTVEKDYEEHVRNKALLSYDSRWRAEELAEYLAGEILEMRRLEWLKGKIEEILSGLTPVERTLVGIRYFGKRKPVTPLPQKGGGKRTSSSGGGFTERTYFRKQQRLGEKLASLLSLAGVTEEVYLRDYADVECFKRIRRCLEAGGDKKISANERRWIGV